MPCFTFYIFNRKGACQYYHEWQVRRAAGGLVVSVLGRRWVCEGRLRWAEKTQLALQACR